MLVLTRKPGEQIVIGNGIRVTVVSVGPGRVKIGIEAPPNVRIDRSEIHERILHEQASDVLEAVGRAPQLEDGMPTMVAAGETDLKLHNRIAEQLPVPAVERSATAGPVVVGEASHQPEAGANRFRANRKPR
jgi:carbon storage regulator